LFCLEKSTLQTQVKELEAQSATIESLNKKLATSESSKQQLEEKVGELTKSIEIQSLKHSQYVANLKQQHQVSLASIQTENAEDAQSKISALAQEIEQHKDTNSYVRIYRWGDVLYWIWLV